MMVCGKIQLKVHQASMKSSSLMRPQWKKFDSWRLRRFPEAATTGSSPTQVPCEYMLNLGMNFMFHNHKMNVLCPSTPWQTTDRPTSTTLKSSLRSTSGVMRDLQSSTSSLGQAPQHFSGSDCPLKWPALKYLLKAQCFHRRLYHQQVFVFQYLNDLKTVLLSALK